MTLIQPLEKCDISIQRLVQEKEAESASALADMVLVPSPDASQLKVTELKLPVGLHCQISNQWH